MPDNDSYSFVAPPPEVLAAARKQFGVVPEPTTTARPTPFPNAPGPFLPNVAAPLSLPHPADVDAATTAHANTIASLVVPPTGLQAQLGQASGVLPTPTPGAQFAPPSYQIGAPEPPPQGPLIMPTGRQQLPQNYRTEMTGWQAAQQPIITSEDIDKAFPFLVGPFALHKGVLKSAAAMTSPLNTAIAVGTGGLGEIPGLTAQIARAGLSAYFATQAGQALLQKYPPIKAAVQAGDWQKALELGGEGLGDAAMLYGAGKHALTESLRARYAYRIQKAQQLHAETFGTNTAGLHPGDRFVSPQPPPVQPPGPPAQPVSRRPSPVARPVGPRGPEPAPAQPTRSALRVEPAPPLFGEPQGQVQAQPQGPEPTTRRPSPVARRVGPKGPERPAAPQAPFAKARGEVKARRREESLAEQKRRKAEREGTVAPVHGPSEEEQRLAHARDNLARKYFGTDYADVAEESDRRAIDELIGEDLGHAVERPGDYTIVKEPPAEVRAAAEKQFGERKVTGKETEEKRKESGKQEEVRTGGAPGGPDAVRGVERRESHEQPQRGGERAPAVHAADEHPAQTGGGAEGGTAPGAPGGAATAAVGEAPPFDRNDAKKREDRVLEALGADEITISASGNRWTVVALKGKGGNQKRTVLGELTPKEVKVHAFVVAHPELRLQGRMMDEIIDRVLRDYEKAHAAETPATEPEAPKHPIQPGSQYEGEENPDALYDASVEELRRHKAALDQSARTLALDDLTEKQRKSAEKLHERAQNDLDDKLSEIAQAFGDDAADEAWDAASGKEAPAAETKEVEAPAKPAVDKKAAEHIRENDERWARQPYWGDSYKGGDLKEGDPGVTDVFHTPKGDKTVVAVWRTATEKDRLGRLHVTLMDADGRAIGMDTPERTIRQWQKEGVKVTKGPGRSAEEIARLDEIRRQAIEDKKKPPAEEPTKTTKKAAKGAAEPVGPLVIGPGTSTGVEQGVWHAKRIKELRAGGMSFKDAKAQADAEQTAAGKRSMEERVETKAAEDETEGPQSFTYGQRGKDNVSIILKRKDGQWFADVMWNLQGQAGGAFGTKLHSEPKAALEEAAGWIRRGMKNFPSDAPAALPGRVRKMSDWLDSLEPEGATKEPPAAPAKETKKAKKAETPKLTFAKRIRELRKQGLTYTEAQAQAMTEFTPVEHRADPEADQKAIFKRMDQLIDAGMIPSDAKAQAEKEAAGAEHYPPVNIEGPREHPALRHARALTKQLAALDPAAMDEPTAALWHDRYMAADDALHKVWRAKRIPFDPKYRGQPLGLKQLEDAGAPISDRLDALIAERQAGAKKTKKAAKPAETKETKKAEPAKPADMDETAKRLQILSFVASQRATPEALQKAFPNDADEIRWLADRGMIRRLGDKMNAYYGVPKHGRDYQADPRIDKAPEWWTAEDARVNAYEPEAPAEPAPTPEAPAQPAAAEAFTLPTGKDKLTNAEIQALENADVVEGHEGYIPGISQDVFLKLRDRGWMNDEQRLTDAGKAAVKAYRADKAAKAEGVPMSLYVAAKKPTLPAADPKNRFETQLWNTVDGEVWHTDGHGAWKGDFPKNWPARNPNATNRPDIQRVVPKERGDDITPIGFSDREIEIPGKKGKKERQRLVYFSNGAAMQAKYFDYTNSLGNDVRWTQAPGPKGQKPGREIFQAWDKDGNRVGLVMPMRVDVLPENLKGSVEEGPKPAAPKKKTKGVLEKLDEAGRRADERLRKNFPPGRLNSELNFLDPDFVRDQAHSIAGLIARGLINFASFSKDMLGRYGYRVRPALGDIWTTAQRLVPDVSALMDSPLALPGQGLTHDLGAALERTVQASERLPRDSDPDARAARALEQMVRDAVWGLQNFGHSREWYDGMVAGMERRLAANDPDFHSKANRRLFKYFLAILSNGVDPETNFAAAMKGWGMYRRDGEFSAYDAETPSEFGNPKGTGLTFRANSYEAAVERLNRLIDDLGVEGAVKWLKTKHPVSELRQRYDDVPGNRTDLKYGSYIFGEKVGAFGANLNGIHTELTADKWWSRTWNRWMGTVMATDAQGNPKIDDKTGLPVLQDEPRNETERNLMRDTAAKAAQMLGLKVSELQAVLWYTEQALYRAHGIDAGSIGYDEAAANYFRQRVQSGGNAENRGAAAGRRAAPDAAAAQRGAREPASEVSGRRPGGAGRRGPESGAISPDLLNALTLGLGKFVAQDVAPKVKDVALGIAETAGDIRRVLFPTLMDRPSQRASFSLRSNIAEMQRRYDQAAAALRGAFRYFERQKRDDNLAFMHRMELGQPQPTPELQTIADALRALLDGRRLDVQALGTGKLQRFYQDYFPHIWKKPKQAANVIAEFFGRRPFEGSKAFLKQRSLMTIQDGIARGLEPVSDNPVTLALYKMREMDRYIMAHTTKQQWARTGLAKFVDSRKGKAPKGWRKLPESIGTVYGPSVQSIAEYPNEGLWQGLDAVAKALGITHKRGFGIGLPPGALGASYTGKAHVKTAHGTAEGTLAHEIGHQIDELAGSGNQFVLNYPDPATVARLKQNYATLKDPNATPAQKTAARADLKALKGVIANRREFAEQLRRLADLRTGGSQAYRRSREEKMAQLAQMWVEGRPLFEKTAPLVFRRWKKFLNDNPKLHALRDIQASANKTMIAQPYDVGGLVVRGHWWAPAGASRILDNYLSPGLRQYALYRGLMGLNNGLNQYQLGLSAFHLGFTAADATVSKNALAWQSLLRGHPLKAAKYAAETPLAPFTYFLQGNKMLREWYKPGSQGAEIGKLVDGLVAAGGRARMDSIYRTHMHENLMAAYRKGNILGAALRVPFAGAEAFSNLIMDQVVPRMKLGAFADMARAHMEQLGPNASRADVQRALVEDWNSVENRLGEMTYDNLFWDRYLKDLSMLMVRSVGWNLGTLREIGGGIGDIAVQPMKALKGEPVNLNRLSYIMGLLTVNATISAIYQYMHTGKPPDELEDYFFPKTGQTDERGRPQRASFPTYVKDIYHYGTRPVKTIANKLAPIWSSMYEMAKNKDFYGNQIRNADDPLVSQLADAARYAAKQAIPLTARNIQRERTLGAAPEMQAEQFVGITPAPSDLDQTPAERLASDLIGERIGGEPGRPADAAERRDLRQSLARALRQGKAVPKEVTDAIRAGKLTSRDLKDAYRTAHENPLQNQFLRLPIGDALKVYKAASAEERAKLRGMLKKKGLAALKSEAPAQRIETLKGLREALAVQ